MITDGRNPQWEPGSVPVDLWEAVLAHFADAGEQLSGPNVGRLRLALDTLAEADELVSLARGMESARDAIAGYAGARAARKAASDLVAELTAPEVRRGPGRPAKDGAVHGHRTQKEKQVRNEGATLPEE